MCTPRARRLHFTDSPSERIVHNPGVRKGREGQRAAAIARKAKGAAAAASEATQDAVFNALNSLRRVLRKAQVVDDSKTAVRWFIEVVVKAAVETFVKGSMGKPKP